MKELQNEVFEGVTPDNMPYEKQLFVLGAFSIALAEAVRTNNEEEAWIIMQNVSKIAHPLDSPPFNALYNAVAAYLAARNTVNEFHYQSLFKEHAPEIELEVISRKTDRQNIPDAWVKINNEEAPVEVKKNNFDWKAAEQLERYMNTYHTRYGVAVGRKLTANLPNGALFVGLDKLEGYDGK